MMIEMLEERVLMSHGHRVPAPVAPVVLTESATFVPLLVDDPTPEAASLPQFPGMPIDVRVQVDFVVTQHIVAGGDNAAFNVDLAASEAVAAPGVLASLTVTDRASIVVADYVTQDLTRVSTASRVVTVTDPALIAQYVGGGAIVATRAGSAVLNNAIVSGPGGNSEFVVSYRATAGGTITITCDYAPVTVFNSIKNKN